MLHKGRHSFQFPVVILLCQWKNKWLIFGNCFFPCFLTLPLIMALNQQGTWVHKQSTLLLRLLTFCMCEVFQESVSELLLNPVIKVLVEMPTQQVSVTVTMWAVQTQCNERMCQLCSWRVLFCNEPRSDKTWLYWSFHLWLMHLNKLNHLSSLRSFH